MTEIEASFNVASRGPALVDAAPAVLGSERDPFARALRVAGALLLTASASTFMFQHWNAYSDVVRYWMLLGHTLAIVVAALLCSTGLRAARSARTLFGLVLISPPVHAAVLGALLYSRIGAVRADLPSSAIWAAPSLGAALLTAAAAAALLIPAGALALRVLARNHAGPLGALLVGANALLLIPVREPTLIGGILVAATVVLLLIDRRLELAHELRTFEGRTVRLLCLAPLLVMAGRTLLFYDVTKPFVACVLAALGFTWFSLFGRLAVTRTVVTLQRLSILPVTLAALLLVAHVAPTGAGVLCFCALTAVLLVLMGQRALGGQVFYGAAAGWIACVAAGFNACASIGTSAAAIAILIGACAMVGAALLQRYGLLVAGAVTTASALLLELYLTVEFGALKHWGTLAASGLVLVLGAAVLEKHGRHLGQRAVALRAQISAWDW
jgi:hypothetical protein